MKVYLTRKNKDMTEGRGPMVLDKCFLHEEHAKKYIDTRPGVMGWRCKWSEQKYGDWEVIPLEVIEEDIIGDIQATNEINLDELESFSSQKWEEYISETYQGKRLVLSISLGSKDYRVTLGDDLLYLGGDKRKAKYAYENVTKLT